MAWKLEIWAIEEMKIQLRNKNVTFKSNDTSSSSKR